MNLTTISGHTEALVAKVVGTAIKGDLIEFASDLTEGEVAIVGLDNVVIDASNIVGIANFKLVTNRNGVLRYSTDIKEALIASNTTKVYAAPTYKSMTIGYNGTSGSMDVTEDRELFVKIFDVSKERHSPTKDEVSLASIVIPDSATQELTASNLFEAVAINSKRGEAFVHVSMLLSGAVTAGTAAKVSNGGKTVTFATAVTGIAVGGYLSFYGEFYKVAALANSNKTVTLKSAYQGKSELVALANVKAMTALVASTANAGIKITVVTREYFRTGFTSAIVFDFELGIKGFQVAGLSELAKSYQGSGTARQIAELEWFAEGNQGTSERLESALGVDPEFIPSVSMASTYDQTIVTFGTQSKHTIFGGAPTFDNQLTLASVAGIACKAKLALIALATA
jgi:hypothetical protein